MNQTVQVNCKHRRWKDGVTRLRNALGSECEFGQRKRRKKKLEIPINTEQKVYDSVRSRGGGEALGGEGLSRQGRSTYWFEKCEEIGGTGKAYPR